MNESPPPLNPRIASGAAVNGQAAPTTKQGGMKGLGPVGAVLALLIGLAAKFKVVLIPFLKFFPIILKTGGTMFISVWFYAMNWGWWFAVGFVLLILVHECGHLVVARMFGLKVGAPVFIPFMGAIIALKDAPHNAWMEAWVGIGGPIFGTFGAVLCEMIFLVTGNELFRALAYTGFFLNLFNMAPVGFLDGGRIATAISPWLWIIGLVIVTALAFVRPNFILILIIVMSLPRLLMLFRKRTDEEVRYFELSGTQRLAMSVLYFGLLAFLVLGMHFSHIAPPPGY